MTDLVSRALSGERAAIARVISLAEAGGEAGRDAMAAIYGAAGRAHVVGITGAPGAGKSTLVNALARHYRQQGKTVGIVAVDPSSPFSGGAVLGDRVRMADLAGDDGVFIRSLATQGALGGLARPAMDTVDVLDAAGFEVVLIETVGVGQDEVDIARAAQTVLVASPPGLGDGVQAIKAGVLEIADIHVVTKADRPGADKTRTDLESALDLGLRGRGRSAWQVPVLAVSAPAGTGIGDLAAAISGHHRHLMETGEGERRQAAIAGLRLQMAVEGQLRSALDNPTSPAQALIAAIKARTLDPATAAVRFLADVAKT